VAEQARRAAEKAEALGALRERLTREHHLESLWLTRLRRGIVVELIVVESTWRGNGCGALAMQSLVGWADLTGTRLGLTPSDEYGSNPERLSSWFGSLGFEPRENNLRTTLVREPRIA